jgi:creatinine amidohydrolase
MKLSDKAWPDVPGGRAVIACGSFEQHGPHLPLSTDTLIAEAVASAVAKKIGAHMGPTIPAGISPEHMGFPGTITLSPLSFKALVTDIASSLKAHGFYQVIVVNGHGGNNSALDSLKDRITPANLTAFIKPYDHAGEVETSLIMRLRPELVNAKEIRKHEFSWPGKREWKDTRDFSKSGVLGDPTQATAEKGEKFLKQLIEGALNAAQ